MTLLLTEELAYYLQMLYTLCLFKKLLFEELTFQTGFTFTVTDVYSNEMQYWY